jgi:hypothetical protein
MANNSHPSAPRPVPASASLAATYLRACDELMNAVAPFCELKEVPDLDNEALLKLICGLFAVVAKLQETFDVAFPLEEECQRPPPPSPTKSKR